MTVSQLRLALQHAATRAHVTIREVAAFARAAKADGTVSPTEAAALRAFARQHHDRFDPAATKALNTLLASVAPARPVPAPAPTGPTDWATFDVPASRDQLTGSQRDEGLATFDQLSGAVAAGTLSASDQLLLAEAAAKVGVMGQAQATRAVTRLSTLSPGDAQTFRGLADRAASALERAFLFKALGANTPLAALSTFADAIRGWPATTLLGQLSLSDAIVDDRAQTGLIQQFNGSCVITTAELLRGEVDPVYALATRTANPALHQVDEHDAFKDNPALAKDQGEELDRAGGYPTPRIQGGVGIKQTAIDAVYDARADQTGYRFTLTSVGDRPELTTDGVLDLLAAQLRQGIPTPVLVGDGLSAKRHAMLALEVVGEGDGQAFRFHDPWSGNTLDLTRAQFRSSSAPLGDFDRLGAIHLARPADGP
jgi:hypothetical protein